MADSLSLRQRATIHASYWSLGVLPLCCAQVLRCKKPAGLISFHFCYEHSIGTGLFFLVTPMQSKSCVTQVGSTVVCSSYNIFLPLAQAGTVATGAPAVSPTVPLHSSFPHKKRKRIKNNKKGLFQLKY